MLGYSELWQVFNFGFTYCNSNPDLKYLKSRDNFAFNEKSRQEMKEWLKQIMQITLERHRMGNNGKKEVFRKAVEENEKEGNCKTQK